MLFGKKSEYETIEANLMIKTAFNFVRSFPLNMKIAMVLKGLRRTARMNVVSAAKSSGLSVSKLIKYELGIKPAAMCDLYKLLKLYRANEETIFLFCTAPVSFKGSLGLGWLLAKHIGNKRSLLQSSQGFKSIF